MLAVQSFIFYLFFIFFFAKIFNGPLQVNDVVFTMAVENAKRLRNIFFFFSFFAHDVFYEICDF